MSHSVILRPVHETSPPPLDDDADEDDLNPTIQNDDFSNDGLNNSNEDWKSVDENNDTDIAQIQDDDDAIVNNENKSTTNEESNENIIDEKSPTNQESNENVIENEPITNEECNDSKTENIITNEENNNDDNGWANFATFENTTEIPTAPTSDIVEENTENDWVDFESNTAVSSEPVVQPSNDEETKKNIEQVDDDDDDDFGEFSEVQVAPTPQTSSLPTDTLSTEQIESLISTCFPMECSSSSTDNQSFTSTELPSFTTYKDQTKKIPCLESSLSLWNVLSNIPNDPIGIQFQWRKSTTERLFHQALGVNERFRTKSVPLTPEILQPEKVKSSISTNSESENIDNENKLSTESIRPHFDWKQSGLQNPLADNDNSSLSSKNEDNVFDANKTLDLDFYVPTTKSSNEEESPSSILKTDSPIIPSQQRNSIPIKTMDLFPGSTTTLNDDAKRIIDTLPNLSFMNAKALMFPIRFNTNTNDETPTLY